MNNDQTEKGKTKTRNNCL